MNLEVDLVIRARHDRKPNWKNQVLPLSDYLSQSQVIDTFELDFLAQDHYSWTSVLNVYVERPARADLEVRLPSA